MVLRGYPIMVGLLAGVLAVAGVVLVVFGYLLSISCGGLGLAFYGLGILAFGAAGATVAGIRVLSISVPFGLVILLGGLYFANLSGCL